MAKDDTKTRAQIAREKARKRAQALKGKSKGHANGFVGFVREQGVVGLAVGLAVGTAASSAVKTIVDEFVNPIVGFVIGGIDLTNLKWVVVGPGPDGVGGLTLGWGAILSAIITLLATAYLIYWLVHVARLDRLDKKK